MHRVIILGCGGHARSIADVILDNNEKTDIVFFDRGAKVGETILGFQAVTEIEYRNDDVRFLGIGGIDDREKYITHIYLDDYCKYHSIVSKRAIIGNAVNIGLGVFVAKMAYIGVEACIGDFSIVNTASVIEHEVKLGKNVHVAPNTVICGRSIIGNDVFVGAGSTIVDKVRICDHVVIGAGSLVLHSISESGTYVGNPVHKVE